MGDAARRGPARPTAAGNMDGTRQGSGFGDALRRHRGALGLTQEALAERTGLSQRAVSDLERGLKRPRRATLRLLLRALALSPEQAAAFEEAGRGQPRCPAAAGHNLPAPLTRFVGRAREAAEIRRLLQPGRPAARARLVTLTGAGGCGKTRLALEAAGRLIGAFPGGVWFVDLAPLADPVLVPPAVLALLVVQESQVL
jgi:transcriptional regulator with XRE-family HTH domain